MFCRKCGAKLKDEDKFCFNCGTPTTQEEAPKVTQEKVEPEPKEKLEDSLLDLDVEEENNEFDKDIIWEDPLADEMNKPEEDIEANKILEKFQKVKSENKKTAVEKEVVKEEVVEEPVKEKTAMEGKIPIKETSTVVKETEEEPVKEEVNESESTEQLEQIPIMAQGKVTNDPIVKEVVEEPVKEEIVEKEVVEEPVKEEVVEKEVVKEPVKAEPVEKEVEKEPITEPVKEEVVEEPVKEVEKKIKREKRIVGQKPVSYNETDKPLKEKLISKEKLVAKTTNNPELNIIENKSEEIKSEKDTSLSDTPSFINNKEVINNNLDKEKSAIKSVPKKETSVKHDISKEYVSQPKDELDEVNLDEGLNSFTDKLTSALIVILIIVIIIVFVIFLFKYFGLN